MTDPASLIPIPPPPEDDDFAFEANLDFPERYPGLGQLNDLIKKLPPEGQPNLSPNEAPDLASFASRKTLEKAFKNSQSSLNSLEPNAELTTLPQSHDEELGLGDPFNFPADYPKRDQTTTNQETVAETTNKPPIKDENPAAFASLKSPKAPILNSEASSVNSETSSELSSEPSSELNSETSSELNSEASPELNSEPSSELSSEASSEASPELSSEASSELSSEASPELSSEANPELNSEPSFELNSEASFELNSEASSELTSEASPELSLTASSELNSEPSSEPSLTTNSEPSLTTNSEPSPTTSSELNSEASSELNSEASSELNSGAISELNSEASSELNSEAISELNSEASSEASSEAPLGDEGFGPVDTLTFPDDYPKRDQTEATKKLPPENPANLPPIEDTPLYGNRPVRIFEIVNALLERNPNADEDLVNRAYVFAATAHQGATRRSGEPYLIHPLAVAWILTDMRLDATTVAAGLLHDVVEDTKFTKEDIQKEFGEDVAKIVAGVTKIGKLEFKSDTERAAANMRNMILAMLTDPRVILVK
ncbi:MAG: HD domain-containing protein, partial [Deltaproteobacteria bacterium]|nr:HD domain-containing protein [Deltaproteobacteria bacterium]